MDRHLLSLVAFIPFIGMLLLLFLPKEKRKTAEKCDHRRIDPSANPKRMDLYRFQYEPGRHAVQREVRLD